MGKARANNEDNAFDLSNFETNATLVLSIPGPPEAILIVEVEHGHP